MISIRDVSKIYHRKEGSFVVALDKICLEIKRHERFGIIGESGSGKSTLLRMINMLEKPDKGEVWLDQVALSVLSEQQQRTKRKRIGMIFQHFNLLKNQTVWQNVGLPLRLERRKDSTKIRDALDFVNLADKAQLYPKQLSGGEKQRVGIARALITQPEILLCDEPTSALDGQNADEIMALLYRVNETFGTTLVIVSHQLHLIKHLCQRTAILDKGKLLEILTLSQTAKAPQFSSYYARIREVLKQ